MQLKAFDKSVRRAPNVWNTVRDFITFFTKYMLYHNTFILYHTTFL